VWIACRVVVERAEVERQELRADRLVGRTVEVTVVAGQADLGQRLGALAIERGLGR
jgi:hypothetical protein